MHITAVTVCIVLHTHYMPPVTQYRGTLSPSHKHTHSRITTPSTAVPVATGGHRWFFSPTLDLNIVSLVSGRPIGQQSLENPSFPLLLMILLPVVAVVLMVIATLITIYIVCHSNHRNNRYNNQSLLFQYWYDSKLSHYSFSQWYHFIHF